MFVWRCSLADEANKEDILYITSSKSDQETRFSRWTLCEKPDNQVRIVDLHTSWGSESPWAHSPSPEVRLQGGGEEEVSLVTGAEFGDVALPKAVCPYDKGPFSHCVCVEFIISPVMVKRQAVGTAFSGSLIISCILHKQRMEKPDPSSSHVNIIFFAPHYRRNRL